MDANNERAIMDNLSAFFQGKTVLIVAHRLSTVRHADQIVVSEKGEIVETGNHEALIKKRWCSPKYADSNKSKIDVKKSEIERFKMIEQFL